MTISIIILALIIGVFFSLDLFFNRKKSGSFVRAFIYIMTVSIPALYQGVYSDKIMEENSFASLWSNYFYPFFGLGILLIFLGVYIFTYNPLKKKHETLNEIRVLTFLDFLYNGYHKFKEDLEKNNLELDKIKKKNQSNYIKTISGMDESLRSFIHRMFITLSTDTDADGYVSYFISEFIETFFGTSNARFTFRKLDDAGKNMITILTTSNNEPAPIPINKRNLIEQSRKIGKPLIRSRYKHFHHKTKNDSHGNNKYDDYVSYCLVESDKNVPLVSLSLDVKGEAAIQRMHALVDSSIYQIICQILTTKILEDNE
jgi:hypothetical protein